MSNINGKTIRTKDITALYDILLAEAEANPSQVAADSTPKDHVDQILTQKMTEFGYPMAQNLSRILDTHNTKLSRNGGQRATANDASEMAEALYTAITSQPLARSATAAPASINSAAAAASTANTDAETATNDAAEANATDSTETTDAEETISMSMNSDFTIAPASAQMIDTTLASMTGNAVSSFGQLLASMANAEQTADEATAANESVQAVVDAYKAGNGDVDESTIKPLPDYELSGYADLSTDNPMVAVLDNLISQGVTPEVTYVEVITRIKNSETAIAEARLVDKTKQRELRQARPKDARPVTPVQSFIKADSTDVADELNAHVQVADQVASDVFTSSYGASPEILGFEVPTLEFDDTHPNVPVVDESFRFYAPVLCEALHSIAENEIMWLYGDSGCGKSEFWAQLAARLNMPFTRMNLDGHLTRSDIVGVNRMLPNEDKQMEMRFVEGILPRAMSRPGILLLDEFDLGDPEIMPIFQPILEGNPLTILEDGGRIVHPHPLFRIAITGNTIGLGSANQMYNNAFEQSAATRDRISSFVRMPYMLPDIEKEVVLKRIPGADEEFVTKLIQLANKVRDGFSAGEIHQIFSTRSVLYCAKRYARFAPLFPSEQDAADEILRTVILGRMDETSHNVVKGLIDNIFE